MRVSSEVHAICHCSIIKFILVSSSRVSSFIWFELASKNCVWKFSRFSFGMGFSILGVVLVWVVVLWRSMYWVGFVVV